MTGTEIERQVLVVTKWTRGIISTKMNGQFLFLGNQKWAREMPSEEMMK